MSCNSILRSHVYCPYGNIHVLIYGVYKVLNYDLPYLQMDCIKICTQNNLTNLEYFPSLLGMKG